MSAVHTEYAIAFPMGSPIDFDALRAAIAKTPDEELDDMGHWGKSELTWALDSCEQLIKHGDIENYEEDGWTVIFHTSDDYGDGGDDSTQALNAVCAAMDCDSRLGPGKGGVIYRRINSRADIPKIADRSEWMGH